MQEGDSCLCSELIRVSGGGAVSIGNLEQISPHGCQIAMEAPIATGTAVRMHCVSCPLGKKDCTECRFRGRVLDQETDPQHGCQVRIEFEGRIWTEREWRPRHFTDLKQL